MVSRKPVVSTNLSMGVSFAGQDGKTGKAVPSRGSDTLIEAINILLKKPYLEKNK